MLHGLPSLALLSTLAFFVIGSSIKHSFPPRKTSETDSLYFALTLCYVCSEVKLLWPVRSRINFSGTSFDNANEQAVALKE